VNFKLYAILVDCRPFHEIHEIKCLTNVNDFTVAFIFHMLIDPDRGMTHIDIGLSRSKVKVRRVTFVK